MSYLEDIFSPDDVKKLNISQLYALSDEIRQFLIRNVSETGGHLSSNLGTVELIVALHKVFSSPSDAFVFDVGHQCYTHKILTGRRELFPTLRKAGGLSGFPCPEESEHDPFVEGHGNAALSQGIGLAQAKKLKGEPGYVVVVVGDGAFTGGMVYEGINNVAKLDNLIVILNDNKMSISKNVGAISRYFTRLRADAGYNRAKKSVQGFLYKLPVIGRPVAGVLVWMKGILRRCIYRSTWFEDMGFTYHGPMDGHDITQMCKAFTNLQQAGKPLFFHLVTKKGKGFLPAEENPGAFHGVPAFDMSSVPDLDPDNSVEDSFSDEFGRQLCEQARTDCRICAITAAMKYGTGLHYIRKKYPERTFDVGMAEQHAVTFAVGLARGGMVPVVAIYSTFLQRAYDQIIHDVMLNHANVLFAVDRAGLVPGDGETHQGIYDVAFLSQMADLLLLSPSNYEELRFWLEKLLQERTGPRAIRYSKGTQSSRLAQLGCSGQPYDIYEGSLSRVGKVALVSYGTLFEECLKANELLGEDSAVLVKLVQLHPLPDGLVERLSTFDAIVFAEESIRNGSLGQQLCEALNKNDYRGEFHHLCVKNQIDHATVSELRTQQGIDASSIAREVLRCGKIENPA